MVFQVPHPYCNPSSQEDEEGGSQVQGQPEQQGETTKLKKQNDPVEI